LGSVHSTSAAEVPEFTVVLKVHVFPERLPNQTVAPPPVAIVFIKQLVTPEVPVTMNELKLG